LHEFFQNKVGIRVGNKVGYSQHNSQNDAIMYNIANILALYFFANKSKK